MLNMNFSPFYLSQKKFYLNVELIEHILGVLRKNFSRFLYSINFSYLKLKDFKQSQCMSKFKIYVDENNFIVTLIIFLCETLLTYHHLIVH